METVRSSDFLHIQEDPNIVNLHRFWGRRLTSSQLVDDDFFDELHFSSQDVDEALLKSRTCSPAPQTHWDTSDGDSDKENSKDEEPEPELRPLMCLDAAALGDIPARYVIPSLPNYEFPVVGVYVDPRVVPGFMYKVRVLPEAEKPEEISYLFGGKPLQLLSIGRGYSRRLTFEADGSTTLNDNSNYFWADSRSEGFGFELHVVGTGDKFMIHDPSRLVAGTLEIIDIQVAQDRDPHDQGHQEEVSQKVLKEATTEKRVKVKAMCKIEWFDDSGTTVLQPISGLAVAVKKRGSGKAVLSRIVSVTIGRNHKKRGFTLTPGVKTNWRRTVVNGTSIGDVPAKYTVTGLESYELPVIGTYVDPRILPGFRYKVRPAESKKKIFNGQALRLVSIGMGYAKRLTFEPEANQLNTSENHFWSDSIPCGYGFEPVALDAGLKFVIQGHGRPLGHAQIFRVDAPQKEVRQETENTPNGPSVVKYIEVDVTCHVTLLSHSANDKVMRVTGTAVVGKSSREPVAVLLRVENIGLDSQINLLFVHEQEELIFLPVKG
ncbi:hypothetical protein RUM43_014036 [Polyplax serrata]|uniref:Uncharacterized protein n=1 Tax=Polyplax serrata TaxID=468196 RepID=A0AAN8S2Q8_POLSC